MRVLVYSYSIMTQKKDIVFSFRVPVEAKQKLREMAKAQNRTMTSIVREIMKEIIEESKSGKIHTCN